MLKPYHINDTCLKEEFVQIAEDENKGEDGNEETKRRALKDDNDVFIGDDQLILAYFVVFRRGDECFHF